MVRSCREEDSFSPVLLSEGRLSQKFTWRDTYVVTRKISIVLRCSGEGSGWDRLGTRRQVRQLSPHHAGRAGLQIQHLLSASRFSAMLLSPRLSASGEAVGLEDVLRILSGLPGVCCELSRRREVRQQYLVLS